MASLTHPTASAAGPDVARTCARLLVDRLPPGWAATASFGTSDGRGTHADATIAVRDPTGTDLTLVIEAKAQLERRVVTDLAARLAAVVGHLDNAVGVVAARYLNPSVRAALRERGLSYVDATGNVRLLSSRPGLYIETSGADSDPWRGPGRPRGTLKGAPATRVVRALLDLPGPWTVRGLVAASGVSVGATYRVVDYLERQGLVTRTDGAVTVPSWRTLLQEWSRDYGFLQSNVITGCIAPRGLPGLIATIAGSQVEPYAVTGTIAAAQWAPYAPARSAMVYVVDAPLAMSAWGLRPADAGINVLLATPQTEVAFARTTTDSTGLVLAAPAQVAVDLLTGPGRGPEEAAALLDRMETDESRWRA